MNRGASGGKVGHLEPLWRMREGGLNLGVLGALAQWVKMRQLPLLATPVSFFI
ncbi:hypothetical protein DSLASN_31900 [Desulfoluna limicola]|uniref:Uncharacterized protein n=1 Tax=Desulfoluna limicola TaxID=2810562 RepID=A0ABM7PJ14_9BACT|nr:hypothetical protein DSLASN_31900 [Desulfoluna limicola]